MKPYARVRSMVKKSEVQPDMCSSNLNCQSQLESPVESACSSMSTLPAAMATETSDFHFLIQQVAWRACG